MSKIDTFQVSCDGAGIAQIQALFGSDASEQTISAICQLGFAYSPLVMCIDITGDRPAYLVAQSAAPSAAADLKWACQALNRFEDGWTVEGGDRLYSPGESRLQAHQVREVLIASKSTAAPVLASVA